MTRSRSDPTTAVPGPVHTDPGDVTEPAEVVLLAVKTTQSDAAAGWLGALCDDRTAVCVLQNGVEQVERVSPHCPSSTVVRCATTAKPRSA